MAQEVGALLGRSAVLLRPLPFRRQVDTIQVDHNHAHHGTVGPLRHATWVFPEIGFGGTIGQETTMPVVLGPIGQIALSVDNVDIAEAFYTQALGLRKLFRFGDLLFLDCAGVRLMIEKSSAVPFVPRSSTIYFRVPDLRVTMETLVERGVVFTDQPHCIAPMEDHDLWMVFLVDPAGNPLALMQEAPKGWQPNPEAP